MTFLDLARESEISLAASIFRSSINPVPLARIAASIKRAASASPSAFTIAALFSCSACVFIITGFVDQRGEHTLATTNFDLSASCKATCLLSIAREYSSLKET